MSDQQPPQPRGPTPGRNPWVTALLILIGLVLLLPGLCSLIFSAILIGVGRLRQQSRITCRCWFSASWSAPAGSPSSCLRSVARDMR